MRQTTTLTILFCFLLGCTTASYTKPLRAPAGYYQVVEAKEKENYRCYDEPKPYVDALTLKSKYTGDHSGSRSKINKAAYKSYLNAVEDTRALEKIAHKYSKDFIKGYTRQSRDCFFRVLEQWAEAGALMNPESNQVGQAVRKWTNASIASVYLLMQTAKTDIAPADPKQTEKIEAWMRDMAHQIVAFYTDREPRKINNHDYWAGYSVAVTSVILQDRELYQWSMGKFQEGLDRIRPDGFMEHEIKRGRLALKYQNYAIQPMVMLAAYAQANKTITQQQIDQLGIAIDHLVAGIEDPRMFNEETGIKQETDGLLQGWSLAWVPVWDACFNKHLAETFSQQVSGPYKSKRLGGDMSWLFSST